ncbi:hypothetical protein DFJ58DRAFT_733304 [Suillus subalutaceus]|uniref:uncharacterized protein n=1 Tax=Suillus subalutaceus TaxID=48586 RepID=UPI001B87053B|nr:uncharacterized protein DFJ58DRAFT_733304 [Suillus subalutaceus]KAG1839436.1 hypothetical protein DFJ58DRAFT_733304 [Suillus subalutaceus]
MAREEFSEKCLEVDNLQERVRELEKLVIQSQTHKEMAQQLVNDAYRAPALSDSTVPPISEAPETSNECPNKHSRSENAAPSKENDPPSIIRPRQNDQAKSDTRYWRASSLLLNKSSVKQAIVGSNPSDSLSSDSSSDSDDNSKQFSDEEPRPRPVSKLKGKLLTSKKQNNKEDSADDLNARLLEMEPESEHDSDSDETKWAKRAA